MHTKRRWHFMKKQLVLPKFKNKDEEVEFWDKIDLTEYFEPSDFKHVLFPNLKRTTKKLISIRLPEQLLLKVKTKAQSLHVPYQQLIQQLIQQGV